MQKGIGIFLMFCVVLFAQFDAKIYPITPQIQKRMIKGGSWHKGCPVAPKDLRYIRLSYWDFQGKSRVGELIVHQDVSSEIVKIFEALYQIRYPIKQMRLVSDYNGNDWRSIEADNTSAFNCRHIGGTQRWSKHAYGEAIDINPLENPYISAKGYISHKASLKYKKRRHQNQTPEDRALLLSSDPATKIFKRYGWRWGGDFVSEKDYQHFAK
ncbi:MAG: Peptidase 4 protein [Campylobacterota bacterium]|nr:Peptidase 4 protein [Campylobacterota bacterium]